MSWTPKTLSNLPHVLAGPILRKVTPNEVSVMVVTKANCQVQLKIYEYNSNSAVASTLIYTGNYENVVKIGQNVFIKVLYAANVPTMDRSKTYGYNINFDIGGTVSGLGGAGILHPTMGSTFSVSYGLQFNINGSILELPTFILPPPDIKDLRVLHGSCRKPHGEGIDAMSDINSMIYDGINTPGHKRPHMLFLTGDQIYADDVSPILLHMINGYAQSLLGWDENMTSLGADNTKMAPGKRADNILGVAKFSVDKEVAGSHLMKLTEFIIMYLMNWSDVLWEENTSSANMEPVLPDFATVYPGSTSDKEYNAHKAYLTLFFVGLHGMGIPKALANIPVYMIFDDHEITDDLFYNAHWFNEVNGSALGKRIVINGMTSYALFQDWGNKPEDYLSGSGQTLLNTVANIALNPGNASYWNTLEPIVMPKLDTTTTPHKLTHYSGGMKWHYYYEVANWYEFLVLDTRSMRVFNEGDDKVPGLMSDEAMTLQIEQAAGTWAFSQKIKNHIFVITPTPVIGVNYIEKRKEGGTWATSKEVLDLEHWTYDEYVYEHFFSKLFTRNPSAPFIQVILMGGDVHYGYTSRMQYWGNQVFKEPLTTRFMTVAGLCASSFKNEVCAASVSWIKRRGGIEAYTMAYHDDKLTDWTDKTANYGWQNLTHASNTQIDIRNTGNIPMRLPYMLGKSPFVYKRNEHIKEGELPIVSPNAPAPTQDWQYRIDPVYSPDQGYNPAPVSGFSLEQYKDHLSVHQDYYNKGAGLGRYIVGTNNMGDINFEWNSGLTAVVHKLWWWNSFNRTIFNNGGVLVPMGYPHTVHTVDMKYYAMPGMNE